MNPDNVVYQIAAWLIPLIIAIVFHEVAHGYVAFLLGDRTAQRLGRLTLNPIRHIDPIGTVVLPLVLALAHAPIFGWAKPVPVIASRMRNPQLDMALVAMAGPASNLVLGFVAALGVALVARAAGGALPETGVAYFLFLNLINFLRINIFLAIFNMLPLPPFDGGHVVAAVLPSTLCPVGTLRLSHHAGVAGHLADDCTRRRYRGADHRPGCGWRTGVVPRRGGAAGVNASS